MVWATDTVPLVHAFPATTMLPPALALRAADPAGPKLVPVMVTVPPAVGTEVIDETVGFWYLKLAYGVDFLSPTVTTTAMSCPVPAGAVHVNFV